jgi:periplasmic protein TonB
MMRYQASAALAHAVLASILLHALALLALPAVPEPGTIAPPKPEPLIARIEHLKPLAVSAPAQEVRRAAPPRSRPALKPAPAPVADPASVLQAPATVPVPAEPVPAPAPTPIAVARVAPPPAAPASAVIDAESLARYRQDLLSTAASFKRYPRVAVDNDWAGEVVVRMVIGADGRIAALRVARGSGHAVLDRQALQMFEAAKPAVALPHALRGRAFELELRAIYSLRDPRAG